MGLCVEGYSQLELVRELSASEAHEFWVEEEKHAVLRPNGAFPKQAGSIKRGLYRYDQSFSFSVGPYSYYSLWREQLAKLAGVEKPGWWISAYRFLSRKPIIKGPFWSVIHFTDCDGVIGPECSSLLSRDFQAWEARASTVFSGRELELYRNFQAAMKLGSQNGAVEFG